MRRAAFALAAVASLFLAPSAARTSETVLRVETWNVGLAHGFVDHAEARAPAIWDAVAGSDADVVCLQEVWTDEDREAAVAALAPTHPHAWLTDSAQTKASKAPACRPRDLFGEGRFVSCLTGSCGGLEGDALTDCVIDQCEPIMMELKAEKPECATALMAQVGKSAPKALWTVIRPIRKAGIFAYEGSDGLVMVSRLPLENQGMVDFSDKSTLNRRRALFADVRTGDTSTRVYCTHLTADLDGIAPYPGPFASWNEENLTQVNELIAHADAFDGPTILMGDFNCSIAYEALGKPLYAGESEPSCQAFLDAGFEDRAASLGECTYCEANSLVGDDSGGDKLLDHVFVKGWGTRDAAVTHTDRVAIDAGEHHLSDHFGVALSLSPLPPPPPDPPMPGHQSEDCEDDEGCDTGDSGDTDDSDSDDPGEEQGSEESAEE